MRSRRLAFEMKYQIISVSLRFYINNLYIKFNNMIKKEKNSNQKYYARLSYQLLITFINRFLPIYR